MKRNSPIIVLVVISSALTLSGAVYGTEGKAAPYLDANIQTFARHPSAVNPNDDGFIESNKMHSINGYSYGNQPLATITMRKGERVHWYVIGMGTEVDLHTPHWHGNTVLINGMRTDVDHCCR